MNSDFRVAAVGPGALTHGPVDIRLWCEGGAGVGWEGQGARPFLLANLMNVCVLGGGKTYSPGYQRL